MRRFIYGRTTKCCRCYAIATAWSGWLLKSRDGIMAGFCQHHKPKIEEMLYKEDTLMGIYNKEMGFTARTLKTEDVVTLYGLDKNIIEQ